jgi:hypothetical protein
MIYLHKESAAPLPAPPTEKKIKGRKEKEQEQESKKEKGKKGGVSCSNIQSTIDLLYIDDVFVHNFYPPIHGSSN